MGFSLPKLEIPKLELPDINAELNKLTATFDPAASVSQVSSNIISQQSAIESVRANLESIRRQSQLQMANADFNAVKDYTSGLASQVDTACVMASVKPAFTPMTPDSLSNPLASNVLASTTGELTGAALTDTLIANTGNLVAVAEQTGFVSPQAANMLDKAVTGDVGGIVSSDNLTDLAVMGAGMYVSGLTGGVVPPSVCSTVIENVAGNAINAGIAGAMSGDPTAVISAVNNIDPNVDVTALGNAVVSDYTGATAEGLVANTISKVSDAIPTNSWSGVSQDTITSMGTSVLNAINSDGYTGTVGGINYGDPTAITTGLTVEALVHASESGDVTRIIEHSAALLKTGTVTAKSIYPMVDAAAKNVPQTPKNIERYTAARQIVADAAGIASDQNNGYMKAGGRLAEVALGVDQKRKNDAISNVITRLKNIPNNMSTLV